MNIRMKLATMAALAMTATGCASSKMIDSANQQLSIPEAGKAQIVFLRVSQMGGAIQSTVYDATGPESKFIGILSTGKKLTYSVAPGQHLFMVASEAADFMIANVEAGKTYYAMVTPRFGAWKARFSMHPVRRTGGADDEFVYESDKFAGWLTKTQFSENTAESNAWFNENRSDVESKRAEYLVVWKQKSEAELAERTLNADDGI